MVIYVGAYYFDKTQNVLHIRGKIKKKVYKVILLIFCQIEKSKIKIVQNSIIVTNLKIVFLPICCVFS